MGKCVDDIIIIMILLTTKLTLTVLTPPYCVCASLPRDIKPDNILLDEHGKIPSLYIYIFKLWMCVQKQYNNIELLFVIVQIG